MVFGALLVLAVMYSNLLVGGIALAFDIAKPFIIGGVIAFILNLPMKAIEEKLLKKWQGKTGKKLKRPVSMLLAIILVLVIVTLVLVTVVPQISGTISLLGSKIPAFLEDAVVKLGQLAKDYPELEEQVVALQNLEINWDSITESAFGFLIGGVVNVVVAFIFALYILSQKEKLSNQGKRIVSAYCSEKVEKNVLKVFSLLYKNFSSFITGQCLEAVILGALFVIAMSIFRMPYAFMIGVLIAFTALVPVVGAFIGCGVGAFLILIEDPIMALWFVVMFLIIQQVEGNLIYPRVVGNSVGLPSIWVLMAVSLGGSLFGVTGMLFFIPLLATIYTLFRESVNDRNLRKKGVAEALQESAGAVQPTEEESGGVSAQMGKKESKYEGREATGQQLEEESDEASSQEN